MEKYFASILTALAPLFFSFVITKFDSKNKSKKRKNDLEESQNRINFLNSYYEAQTKLVNIEQINSLKQSLAAENMAIKTYIDDIYKQSIDGKKVGLSINQKMLLAFKPISVWGWIWHFLFYMILMVLIFLLLTIFIDDSGNFTLAQWRENAQDEVFIICFGLVFVFLLGVNFAALKSYRISTSKRSKKV